MIKTDELKKVYKPSKDSSEDSIWLVKIPMRLNKYEIIIGLFTRSPSS